MSEKQVNYEYLPWDSDFFGYRTGKITINDYEDSLAAQLEAGNVELLYIFDNTLSEEVDDLLTSKMAVRYDCKMRYEKSLQAGCEYVTDMDIRFYNGKLTTELENLTYSAGKYSRFRKDEKLQIFFKKLYKRWILNSLECENRVLTVWKSEGIIGFISFSINRKTANINLFSVNREYSGKGIGTRLYKFLECFLVKSGVTKTTVSTQMENTRACHFYEKLGFKLAERQNIYHLWRECGKNSV